MHESQVDGATINVSIVLPRRKMSPPPPLARRGANINPLNPPPGRRGGPANGPGFGGPGGKGGRGGRFGSRSDTWRPGPGSGSVSRSPSAGRGRFRGRSVSRSRSPKGGRSVSPGSLGSRSVSPGRGHGRRGYR